MILVAKAVADKRNACFHASLADILGSLGAVVAANDRIDAGVDVVFNQTDIFAGGVV